MRFLKSAWKAASRFAADFALAAVVCAAGLADGASAVSLETFANHRPPPSAATAARVTSGPRILFFAMSRAW